MNYRETAITFDCRGETLVGIVSAPAMAEDTGVLIAVGGPQYRAGSHRPEGLRDLGQRADAVLVGLREVQDLGVLG